MINPGVVIQGPLTSIGRTPRTESIPFSRVQSDDVVVWDCTSQIINLCEKYSSIFSYIVIATWDTENPELINKIKNSLPINAEIILLNDNTPVLPSVSEVIPGNNKFRQIYTTLKGAQKLYEKDCTHVIKIRTDMLINIEYLWRDFMTYSERKDNVFLVPFFSFQNPSHIPDFYFVGSIELFLSVFKKILTQKNWYMSIHDELFHRVLNYYRLTNFFKSKLLNNTRYMSRTYIHAWDNIFQPASYSVYESIYWRGEKFIPIDILNYGKSKKKDKYFLENYSLKVARRSLIKFPGLSVKIFSFLQRKLFN